MRRPTRNMLLGPLVIAFGASAFPGNAQTKRLVPFDEFYRGLPSAQSAAYVGATQAADVATFNEMRQHVLSLYSRVSVKHSFLLQEATYDCIPVMQQPSVRLSSLKTIAAPPPRLPGEAQPSDDAEAAPQIAAPQQKDELGNIIGCANGAIPMRRVTLEDISRFGTLREFFRKGPGDAGQFRPNAAAVAPAHKYAHSYQFVNNIGGSADFNLWDVSVNTQQQEIFSLEQHWYVNTTSTLQTLEGGIQDFPQKYNTTKPALFIYWTADGYNQTGCYNLDCRAFVQTNSNVFLGGPFANYSQAGGKQYQVTLKAYLYHGNWWVYLNGFQPANAIGYYPGSIYQGGPMSRNANEIDYGGETVGSTIWPPMGSGAFPAAGYRHAAYIKAISYFPNASHNFNATLKIDQRSPRCYKDTTHNNTSKGTLFYFGGPGGRQC